MFLRRGEYEQAFSVALSASNLDLVMFLLRSLPESAPIFSDPCPLGQPTLLSFIQQLSCALITTPADNDDETQIKLE